MERPIEEREVEFGRLHAPAAGRREAAASDATWPGLVLIHDVWGLSPHSRALARELAAEGFGVLEIDLYRNLGDLRIEDPGEQIRSLSDPAVLEDLDSAAAWLAREPVCVGRRVGVVGVCMGGTYALLAACSSPRFSAAAPFYGVLSYAHGLLHDASGRDFEKKPHSPIEAAGRLRMPLLASFGTQDAFVPEADVVELEAALSTSGMAFEVDRYAGAGHAFLNRTREEAYHAEASARAWSRVIPFLHAELDAPAGR